MIKQALRIISLVILVSLSFACVAFADVPDPYGRIGRRPIPPVPEVNQYWVYNEFHDTSYAEGKCAIILTYQAPQGSEVQYELKDDAGNLLTKGVDKSEKNGGKITLMFDTPSAGKTQALHFNSSCYVTMVKTSFGMKKTDNPQYVASWKSSYIVKGLQNGTAEIDTAN